LQDLTGVVTLIPSVTVGTCHVVAVAAACGCSKYGWNVVACMHVV
jgi:hypothetical protein